MRVGSLRVPRDFGQNLSGRGISPLAGLLLPDSRRPGRVLSADFRSCLTNAAMLMDEHRGRGQRVGILPEFLSSF